MYSVQHTGARGINAHARSAAMNKAGVMKIHPRGDCDRGAGISAQLEDIYFFVVESVFSGPHSFKSGDLALARVLATLGSRGHPGCQLPSGLAREYAAQFTSSDNASAFSHTRGSRSKRRVLSLKHLSEHLKSRFFQSSV